MFLRLLSGQTDSLHILVVDDHPINHRAMDIILAPVAKDGVTCVATAGEALAAFERDRPSITIIDLGLPDMHGTVLIRTLLERFPAARLVAFSDSPEASLAVEALEAGAMAVSRKSDPPEALLDCVLKVSSGKTWMPESLQQDVALLRLCGGNERERFSRRELTVLRALAYGKSLGEIAHDLEISYKTVTNEVAQLRLKLQARTQPEMIRIALEKKLIV